MTANVDINGRFVAVGPARDQRSDATLTLTATTAETPLIAGLAGTFIDVYGLILSNTSATASEIILRDATGAGTPRSFMVPAGETRGFMLASADAIKQGVAGNTWTAQCGTSISSMKIDALYVRNPAT